MSSDVVGLYLSVKGSISTPSSLFLYVIITHYCIIDVCMQENVVGFVLKLSKSDWWKMMNAAQIFLSRCKRKRKKLTRVWYTISILVGLLSINEICFRAWKMLHWRKKIKKTQSAFQGERFSCIVCITYLSNFLTDFCRKLLEKDLNQFFFFQEITEVLIAVVIVIMTQEVVGFVVDRYTETHLRLLIC